MTTTRPAKWVHRSRPLLWLTYAALVAGALTLHWDTGVLGFTGPLAAAKVLVWIALLAFLGYTVYCSYTENMFRSFGTIWGLKWGRQVGIDLYLGLAVGVLVIYAHSGPVSALVWALPILVYANLAILLYIGIHFDTLVAALGA